jgi:hypothetical protein
MLRRAVIATVVLACIVATAAAALSKRDRDHDGLGDRAEVHRYHTDPDRRDTDRDRLGDRAEIRKYHTNARRRDTDRDGLGDRAEIRKYHTNPRKRDTDRDGLGDRAETRKYHTNPRKRDTDRDTFSDGAEVRAGTNPRVAASYPPPGSGIRPDALSLSERGGGFPGASSTGVPPGTTLHSCETNITSTGTYDACRFDGSVQVKASNVVITRSLIKGSVETGSARAGQQTGLVIRDSEIDCGCQSTPTSTPAAIMESNYTLTRVEIHNSGHGASVADNVTIEDSWIHGLGAANDAHKNGIYSGNGVNVTIRHNNIECDAGDGCTSAIGLLSDFGPESHWTIDNNLLNTRSGSYCFYGGAGPKPHQADHITFTNNHFGRAHHSRCGAYGPVTYWDSSAPGMVWSGNVWADTGATVRSDY